MPIAVGNFSANPNQALMYLTRSVPGERAKTCEIDESQFVHVHGSPCWVVSNFSFCTVRSGRVSSGSALVFTCSSHKCSAGSPSQKVWISPNRVHQPRHHLAVKRVVRA